MHQMAVCGDNFSPFRGFTLAFSLEWEELKETVTELNETVWSSITLIEISLFTLTDLVCILTTSQSIVFASHQMDVFLYFSTHAFYIRTLSFVLTFVYIVIFFLVYRQCWFCASAYVFSSFSHYRVAHTTHPHTYTD